MIKNFHLTDSFSKSFRHHRIICTESPLAGETLEMIFTDEKSGVFRTRGCRKVV